MDASEWGTIIVTALLIVLALYVLYRVVAAAVRKGVREGRR